jgi:hypothetical protein
MIRVPLSAQEGPDHGDTTPAGLRAVPAPIAATDFAALRLLTPAEVVAALRFKSRRPDQILRSLQERGLRVLVIGGRLRVRPVDLMAFEEQLIEETATKAAGKITQASR